MKRILALAVLAVMMPSGSISHLDSNTPEVVARHQAMMFVGAQMRVLSQQARGAVPFNSEQANTSAAAIAVIALTFPHLFPEGSIVGENTDALESILENREDFKVKSEALGKAASDLSDIGSVEQLSSGLAALGQTCRSCHSLYRK
ncbi:MAG: cytochrome c [Rhodobacteraceae bacterium]|nr:cytochrome c [Paracoccaceae bacterium]